MAGRRRLASKIPEFLAILTTVALVGSVAFHVDAAPLNRVGTGSSEGQQNSQQGKTASGDDKTPTFNHPGNILISDQYNNRVIEIDKKGNIVWQFGLGPSDISAASPIGVNDAERIGEETLVAGTGVPTGSPEALCPNGCADNRVMLVGKDFAIDWQYGQFGVTGAGPNQLNTPVQATWLPNFHVLITDQGNQRVIEVNLNRDIVWQYGTTGVPGAGPDQLNSPNSAELLDNGNVLIADENNNRAIEVDRDKNVVATFTASGTLGAVAFASRLSNGHTLLTDAGNNRVVEVNKKDAIVWQYATNLEPGSNPNPSPTRALRLHNGNTIISDQNNDRVIIVSSKKKIVASYGTLNTPGYGTSQASQGLNGPYDAKVIGDFTGITPPFDLDQDED